MYYSIEDRIEKQFIIINREILCPSCNGSTLCWVCNGTGRKTDEQVCGNCYGSGKCQRCYGKGTVEV